MKDTFQRRVDLPGVQNIRDLGGYPTGCGLTTRWRRVLRGDGLHRLTPEGFDALNASGLTSVMDLRSETELANDPNPFMNHAPVTFYHKPVYDDLAPALMATREAGEDDPLIQFYLTALIDRGEAIRDILSTIATAPEGTLLFHCTAGKDRTGLVAALLLEVAGVERETILTDYSLTGEFIHDLVEELLEQTRANGGDAEMHARFLSCAPLTMSATLDQVTRRHGSIANYLTDIGLEAGDISALRDRLLGD